jgi:AraC family transcriptional regulator
VLQSETLFAGCVVEIADVCCRAPESPCGAEEQASSHHIILVRSGVFVKHAGRRQVVAEPTHALFFNRHETYRVSHPGRGGDDCTVLRFSDATLAEVIGTHEPAARDRPETPFSVSHAPLAAHVMPKYHRLRRAVRAGAASALEVEETALEMLHGVVSDAFRARNARPHLRRPDTARARRDLAEATKLLLATNPSANPSLATLARAVRSSPFHLSRVFRQEVGLPVHQYLIRLRLALALDSLGGGVTSLSALAHTLGFFSHSHFTTHFRRTFGTSPSAFRRSASASDVRELRKIVKV